MDAARLKRLQSAGWKSGSVKEFLRLSDEETMLVELRLSPADAEKAPGKKRIPVKALSIDFAPAAKPPAKEKRKARRR